MREQLYACEERALLAYLERMALAEVQVTASMMGDDDSTYDPTGGIYEETPDGATIHVSGFLSAGGPSWIAKLFGIEGTGYRQIMAAVERARERRPARVTLAVNSPGGEVSGVDQAWQALHAMAREIPTTARNDGLMASAAYWLASAAPRIVATSPAAEQGSIGVIIVGIDDSKAGEKQGYKRWKIVSQRAPDKGADVDTAHGRSVLQERADALESVFYARVATGRNTSENDVAANYGKGALLIASAAVTTGMIDAIVPAVEPAREPVGALVAADDRPFHPSGLTRRMVREAAAGAFDMLDAESNTIPVTTFPAAQAATNPQISPNRREPMNLTEVLKANPEAQADYTAALKAERDAGHKDVQTRIDAAKPFLALQATADGYTADDVSQIQKMAAEVVQGTEEISALRSFVRYVDRDVEKRKAAAAVVETTAQAETPAQQHVVSDPGVVVGANPKTAEADLAATIARDRAAQGRPVAVK